MNIIKKIAEQKTDFYNLAKDYFIKIDDIDLIDNKVESIVNKSISILANHQFIETPSIEIKIEVHYVNKEVYLYYLYLSEDKEFIDEFLMSK